MENNMIIRIISGFILGSASIFAILKGGVYFQIFILICMIGMLIEWFTINKNKSTILFFSGILYILIPMLFWLKYYDPTNIIWLFIIVWSCDIFAYFGGKLLKGPKFSPKTSPNKTWSGVIVGSIFAFFTSFIYISKFMDSNQNLIISSVFLIIASIYGDLLESKVKRILNVKDTGNTIPGHGGICDRLDSFLLVTYVFIIVRFLVL